MRPCLATFAFASAVLAQAPDNTIWATNFSGTNRSISKIDPRGEVLLTATPAGLVPFGLAVDAAGSVWAGSNSTQLTRTDVTGATTSFFTVGSFPQSVAIDQNGFAWVANRSSNSVMKVDSLGVVQFTVPLPAGTSPIGIIVDAFNYVWVAGFHANTSTTHTLTVLDTAGNVLNTFSFVSGVPGFGFSFPTADPNGNIWVANQAQVKLLQIDQTGTVVSNTPIASGLPRGCAIDGLGYCWLANQGFTGSCVKVDAAGVILATFPPPATTFTTVSIDGNGDPWVFGTTANATTFGKGIKLWQVDGTPLVEVLVPGGGSAWGGDSSAFHLARTLLPAADFDTDGFPNALEVSNGTNPFEARSTPVAPQPIQSGIANNGTTLNLTYRLRPDANLTYISAISLGNGPTVLPDSRVLPLSVPVVILAIGQLDANGRRARLADHPAQPGARRPHRLRRVRDSRSGRLARPAHDQQRPADHGPVNVARQLALTAAGVALAACNGDGDAAALAARVAALERRLDAADAQEQRLFAALRQHGIAAPAAPPANAAEASARALDDLDAALGRLESAKETQDTAMGQGAMTAVEAALQTLRQDPGAALPALLARAETAAPVRQAALIECYGRVGSAAAAPTLLLLATSPGRPPAMRVQAARALIEVDADAAIPAVDALVQEAGALPELYLLVHLLAGTGKPAAVPVLVSTLATSRDRSVRCHAATGLGNFRGDASVTALATAALGDEYPAVRTNALRALAKVAGPERLREVVDQVVANDADAAVRAVARELKPAATSR